MERMREQSVEQQAPLRADGDEPRQTRQSVDEVAAVLFAGSASQAPSIIHSAEATLILSKAATDRVSHADQAPVPPEEIAHFQAELALHVRDLLKDLNVAAPLFDLDSDDLQGSEQPAS